MADSIDLELIGEQAALLTAVADPTRLMLVRRLASEGRLCVCRLQGEPPLAANLLSYHLKVLRDAGLVEWTRRGRWKDYELTADALERLRAALPGSPP